MKVIEISGNVSASLDSSTFERNRGYSDSKQNIIYEVPEGKIIKIQLSDVQSILCSISNLNEFSQKRFSSQNNFSLSIGRRDIYRSHFSRGSVNGDGTISRNEFRLQYSAMVGPNVPYGLSKESIAMNYPESIYLFSGDKITISCNINFSTGSSFPGFNRAVSNSMSVTIRAFEETL